MRWPRSPAPVVAGVATLVAGVVALGGACASKEGPFVSGSTTPSANTRIDTPDLAGDAAATIERVFADDIPVAHTPEGGWTGRFPEPILTDCTEPLVADAPDLRGMWKVIEVVDDDGKVQPAHNALGHLQRIEQCGDRLVVTAGGVIHDMRCDGSEERGVHDVLELDKSTPITVIASYEDRVHVLRPVGLPIEVTRRRDGNHLIWRYLNFTARMERVGPPETDPTMGGDE